MMKNKFILFISFLLFINGYLLAQPKCFFEHYGAEDGLPQHTIMGILQDQKGFMWFSTWDGLCKFDGYTFYTYKIQYGDTYHMRSNRIDHIYEDKYGYIWTLPYDYEPHRFDPRTEKFMGIRSVSGYQDFSFITSKIIPMKSGKVWLISEKDGCICVTDSTFNIEIYNTKSEKIYSDIIHSIYEDSNGQSWILSNNGLYSLSKNNKITNSYFVEKQIPNNKATQNFYSVMELDQQIWFGSDKGRIWIYNKKNKQFELLETKSSSEITQMININNNQLFIATKNDGFFIYNYSKKDLGKFDTTNLSGLRSNEILNGYVDKSGNIWMELNSLGVAKFNMNTQTLKHFDAKIESLSKAVFPPNYFIFEDKEDRLWVHPRGGGFSLYDPITDALVPFYNEPSSPTWRFSNMMHAAFSDKQGNLWLSTRSHGLEKIIFNNEVFKSNIIDPDINSTINNDIRSIFEDDRKNIWISTKGGKIYVYDSDQKLQGYLCENGSIDYGTPLEGITYCMTQDKQRNIWIGTKGEGVYKLTPTTDRKVYKVNHYQNSENDIYSLSHNSVYSIFEDKKNRIWIGTYGGGLNLVDNKDDGKFINYKNILKSYPSQFGSQIRAISSDQFGNICVGTTLGLIMFSPEINSVSEIVYKSFIRTPNDNNSLRANDIYDIYTTKKGITYLATFGGGVNEITAIDKDGFPTQFTSYVVKDGLPSDVILTLIEDKDEKLWVCSEGNITKFDPITKSFETYSEVNRLMKGQNFSESSKCVLHSGLIYFGHSKGYISINPEKVENNTYKPYIALTKFQISNQDVPINNDSPLTESIDDIKSIKLNHKQNFINIEFAALDYVDPQRVSYMYKLDGFDNDWVITTKQRIANYTNLSPGKYTFRVKSTNSDGIWMDNEHTLKIEITPSFWQTKWAYLLYVAATILLLYIILRTIFIFYRLRDKVVLEREQTEMKSRFFTDISHEIRTPLTMIVSPVEHIIEDEKTPEETKGQLQVVLKNANRMLRMVNQILDFRKIQKQKFNVQETIIGDYIQDICNVFIKSAEAQGMNLKVNNYVKSETLWIDQDSFEKLVFNLLSNALKFTPEGKAIEVNILKRDNNIVLQVKDEGKGMSKEILNKLFTRFNSFNTDKSKPSTGIGLSIVKEVADKHHAKIQVESDENKGSCFSITFTQGKDHLKYDKNIVFIDSAQLANSVEYDETEQQDSIDENNIAEQVTNKTVHEDTILITEDDPDLRNFIKGILQPFYNVLEATNGKEGYEIASKEIPDFILSDIMMPEMDGVELLQNIRKNPETSHIPFILLTAKTGLESKLEGMEYGADDYMTKPFSVKYLKARINNIISQRKSLYDHYTSQQIIEPDTGLADSSNESKITNQDELFLLKIKEEIEKNIDNSDFLVENLVSAMAMSRTVFFKKLKSLTGMAPVEFIRDIKIKYAAQLLATQQYTIKETSFMIGISDTKYFTQCFKKIIGMTPSEYKNQKNK